MNTKTWIPLACALGLGLIAALVAERSMRNKSAGAVQQTVQVAVAKADIAPGTSLTPEDIATTTIPGKNAPTQSFTNPADLVGRVTAAPMLPGQPFQPSLLAAQGVPAGLAALVPTGMRAVTIDVSESGAMAGLLIPGSRVDVVATNVNREHPEKTSTHTFVQNVAVVAVGQKLGNPKADGDKDVPVYRTVTLLATPHDAEALDLALTTTRVRLVLRSTGDRAQVADDGVVAGDIAGVDRDNNDTQVAQQVIPQVIAPSALAVASTIPTTRPSETEKPSVFTRASEPVIPTRIVTVILGNEERQLSFQDTSYQNTNVAAGEPASTTSGKASGLSDTPNKPLIPNN